MCLISLLFDIYFFLHVSGACDTLSYPHQLERGRLAENNDSLSHVRSVLIFFFRAATRFPSLLLLQAAADLPDLLSRVKDLMQHEDFTLKNPNRLRSVVSSFAGSQHKFHAEDGSGYEFLGDMVLEVDQLNPQASATSRSRLVLRAPCLPEVCLKFCLPLVCRSSLFSTICVSALVFSVIGMGQTSV